MNEEGGTRPRAMKLPAPSTKKTLKNSSRHPVPFHKPLQLASSEHLFRLVDIYFGNSIRLTYSERTAWYHVRPWIWPLSFLSADWDTRKVLLCFWEPSSQWNCTKKSLQRAIVYNTPFTVNVGCKNWLILINMTYYFTHDVPNYVIAPHVPLQCKCRALYPIVLWYSLRPTQAALHVPLSWRWEL